MEEQASLDYWSRFKNVYVPSPIICEQLENDYPDDDPFSFATPRSPPLLATEEGSIRNMESYENKTLFRLVLWALKASFVLSREGKQH